MGEEMAAALLEGAEVAAVVAGVDAGDLAQPGHCVGPSRAGRLEVAVGAEGGNHPAGPGGIGSERGVGGQVVARIVRRGQGGDAEPLVQRPRPVLRLAQTLGNLVVDTVGRCRRRTLRHLEDLRQLGLEPVAHRGGAINLPVLAQATPDGA
jgi:hypothetical protein